MKRWLVAAVAMTVGVAVSVCLLIFANPSRDAVDVLVAAHDVPSGARLGTDSIAVERMRVKENLALLFTSGDVSAVASLYATHDLAAGQLIQRNDVAVADSPHDRRLVFVPLKDAPPASPGSKVDLLLVSDSPDHQGVQSFALGVEVRAVVNGGLVLVVTSRQAPAFVYAANAMHLVAVIAEAGTGDGAEAPVSTPEQAMEVAAQK